MLEPKLHFQRFEFKYLISLDRLKEIKSFLQRYVVLDKFLEGTGKNFYEVVSLYYDSPRFYYYWQKVDGIEQRKKVRLRAYRINGKFTDYSFFEIKRKRDSIILKDRLLLLNGDYDKLLKDGNFFRTNFIINEKNNKVAEEFHWETYQRSISPKILVVYNREPYLGKFNKNFRVTFDYFIKARRDNQLFAGGDNFIDLSADKAVMEVKFNGRMPFYIQEIIKMYNLERISYSKYAHAVEGCFDFPLLNQLGYSFSTAEKTINSLI